MNRDTQSITQIIEKIMERGNDAEIKKTKTGYKIFEIRKNLIKEVIK